MNISVKSDIDKAMRWMNDIAKKQVPFAVSVALNKTASRARDEMMSTMLSKLDRPTPFTMEAFRVKNSNKRNLEAVLFVKPIQAKYLWPVFFGGSETERHIVPGRDARLNQYGNLPRRASKGKGTFNIGHAVYKRTKAGLQMVGHFPAMRSYRPVIEYDRVMIAARNKWFSHEWNVAFNRAMLTAR